MTKMQKTLLKSLIHGDLTAVGAANAEGSMPGPMGRCLTSLVDQRLAKSKERYGVTVYSITASGRKTANSL